MFSIKHDVSRKHPKLNFNFKIGLHIDDINILYLIQALGGELQIGTITTSGNKSSAPCGSSLSAGSEATKSGIYVVNKFEDLVEVIIPLFKYAKLRTLKRLDFED